jgi:hypothetical protein
MRLGATPVGCLRSLLIGAKLLRKNPEFPHRSDWVESNIDVEEKKVEVILRLLEMHKSHTITWHQQAYVAAAASIGLMVYIFNSYAGQSVRAFDLTRLIYFLGIAVFAGLSQWYLEVAACNYWGNQKFVIKCEYALKLKDEGVYFVAASSEIDSEVTKFYPKPPAGLDNGMPPEDIILLAWSHLIVAILLLAALALLTPLVQAATH